MTPNEAKAREICRQVAELPDRSSPNDAPEMMLVSHAELYAIATTALDEAVAGGWQPIETLPDEMKVNETRFLAFQKGREPDRYECWWQHDFSNWEGWMDDWDSEPEPTHWQPLTAPAIREGE